MDYIATGHLKGSAGKPGVSKKVGSRAGHQSDRPEPEYKDKTDGSENQTEWLIRIQLRMCYLVSVFLTVPVWIGWVSFKVEIWDRHEYPSTAQNTMLFFSVSLFARLFPAAQDTVVAV